jgi:hypothetical protein
MTDDREMLELAAKAAGIFCKGWCLPGGRSDGWHGMYTGSDDDGTYVRWNPIADDGDAFKLMVQLRLGTLFPTEIGRDRVNVKGHTESLALNDPLAATRRAIVRAAAEIGKGMK